MRINSPRQTEASRKNGLRSKGPKSIDGKKRIKLNALKLGLFSEQVVIESVGERSEDFEEFKKQVWEYYQPSNAIEEMLASDIVDNAWRRRRVRQCETTELNSRIESQEIRDRLECLDDVEKLKTEFRWRFRALMSPSVIEGLCWDDRVQERLASTSSGMDFLIHQMKIVESQVNLDGYLSKHSEAMLSACGLDAFASVKCEWLSSEA
jgi:hypothetical protein